MRNTVGRFIVFCSLALLALFSVYPLLFMAVSSLRDTHSYQLDPTGFPGSLNIANYTTLFQSYPILTGLVHSWIVVLPAVALGTLCSAMAGFTLAKAPFRGSDAVFNMFLLVMVVPGIVLLIPLYVGVARTGLANSFLPAILIYAAINIPFGTYLLRGAFRSFPDALIHAAAVDGAGLLTTFFRVVLPAAKSSVAAVGILTFVNIWNDLIISIVLLHTPETQMLMPALAQIAGTYTTNVPVLMAGLLIAALPPVLTFVLARRYFVSGVTSGALR